jgi:hypothetical protein
LGLSTNASEAAGYTNLLMYPLRNSLLAQLNIGSQSDFQALELHPNNLINPRVLEGGVTENSSSAQKSLKEIGVALRRIKKSSLIIMHEISGYGEVVVRSPNVLLNGTDIPLDQSSILMVLENNNPSRYILRESINIVVSDMKRLEDQVSTNIMHDHNVVEVEQAWKELHQLSQDMHKDVASLVELVQGSAPKSTSKSMKKTVLNIYDKSEKMDKHRKQLLTKLRTDWM